MSYILDALKKSEVDRQRRDAPGVADLPTASSARNPPRWLWLVAGLLLLNVAVLLVLLLRQANPTADAVAAGPARSAEPLPAAPRPELPGDAAAESAAASPQAAADPVEQPVFEPATADRPAADTPVGADEAPTQPARTATAEPAQAAAPSPAAAPSADALRSYLELRANGELALTDLHLDIHVYSETPAERFVFINMSKYRENEVLAEGPRVRRIDADGVILEYRGRAFLLSRD